ncbi:hypothetical protein BBO_07319 [Beauveria brongniartii RCEF 3172]|uniref:Uncharacterized protein n=1 Tax=Beauveria brongniartii RCEF 3172 TaxID=1081107 RepID=A0A166ZI02_9HYPO|nr:hypothetical protein BBO_07319 [Beauveria brongniartii RCEF 3172]
MLSLAPAPIFTPTCDHRRPTVSSPLSSSPLRPSSPLGAQEDRYSSYAAIRQTQSSPIPSPKFRYAACATPATRRNPLLRRREDVQQQRRVNFLRGVRDKAEDKAWRRRDIEGQFLKTNWIADMHRLSYDAPELSEADIEEASSFRPESMSQPEDGDMDGEGDDVDDKDDDDDDMADECGEDAELEAMFASYQQQQPLRSPAMRPISPFLSDDEYDDLFEELLSAKDIDQATRMQQHAGSADDMDME